MHTIQIIWLATWPVSIVIAYYAARKVVAFYENRTRPDNGTEDRDNQ